MNQRTLNCINGYRHIDYNRTVELACFYRTIVTGEGFGKLVRQYKSRETDEQKEQREAITRFRPKAVVGKIEGFFKRPFRVDKIKFNVSHEKDEAKKLITSKIDNYGTDGMSALIYCEETALFYNAIDPNALYFVNNVVNTQLGIDTYNPQIFESKNILDFGIKNGRVEYAVICLYETVQYKDGDSVKSADLAIYYYFDYAGVEIAIEYNQDVLNTNPTYYQKFESNSDVQELKLETIKDKTFLIVFEENTTGSVPLCRVGYNFDKHTNMRTFVSYWDNASELYRMLIDDGSEFDITKIAHVFMQRFRYEEECNFQDGKTKATCQGGTMYPTETKCPKCKGTGGTALITALEDITIRLPRKEDGEQLAIKPSEMVSYIQLPFDIVNFQNELVNTYYSKISEAIFGVDLSQQPNQAATATEVLNTFDQAQDAIYDFTKAPKRMFLFTVQTIAAKEGITDYTAELEYPNEYNLESEDHLIKLLNDAKTAGAHPEIIENISKRLSIKQNRTDKTTTSVYEAMRKFAPFDGLDAAFKQSTIEGLPDSSIQKALALNFKQITDDIMANVPAFLMMSYKEKQTLINQKAQVFADAAVAAAKALTMSQISNNIGQ